MKRIAAILLAAVLVLGMIPFAAAAVAVTGIQTAGMTKIRVGQTVKWTASVLPANATDKFLWWTAGNPGVATVDQNGVITGKRAGQCNITITAKNGVKKTLLLTVGDIPVTGIQTAGKTKLTVGEKVKWTASVLPANATDKYLWWTAGNPGVATVDQNGNITAKRAGKCNITVAAKNGVKKTVLVTVNSAQLPDWKTLYRQKIREIETEFQKGLSSDDVLVFHPFFSIQDVNFDGIPELYFVPANCFERIYSEYRGREEYYYIRDGKVVKGSVAEHENCIGLFPDLESQERHTLSAFRGQFVLKNNATGEVCFVTKDNTWAFGDFGYVRYQKLSFDAATGVLRAEKTIFEQRVSYDVPEMPLTGYTLISGWAAYSGDELWSWMPPYLASQG